MNVEVCGLICTLFLVGVCRTDAVTNNFTRGTTTPHNSRSQYNTTRVPMSTAVLYACGVIAVLVIFIVYCCRSQNTCLKQEATEAPMQMSPWQSLNGSSAPAYPFLGQLSTADENKNRRIHSPACDSTSPSSLATCFTHQPLHHYQPATSHTPVQPRDSQIFFTAPATNHADIGPPPPYSGK